MKYSSRIFCIFASLVLTACGGGGGGGSSSTTTTTAPSASVASAVTAKPVTTPVKTSLSPANSVPIIVDGGPTATAGHPTGWLNSPFVSVTVCSPGNSSDCHTVDHIILDTGSSGLRLMSSALPSGFILPATSNGSSLTIAECAKFTHTYAWGSVKQADVRMAGELASGIAVQIIGDTAIPAVPGSCSNGLASVNTPAEAHANGFIGISAYLKDCGHSCETASASLYYDCPGSTCSTVAMPTANQVGNPVAQFAQDNNGTLIQMSQISDAGAISANGTLFFGIETQSNNVLGAAKIFTPDINGFTTTTYGGKSFASIFDSGTAGINFYDSAIPVASNGIYKPTSTLSLTAVVTGANGQTASLGYKVSDVNAQYASNNNITAINSASSIASPIFSWGFSFFYGRTMYTAISGRAAGAFTGPFVAF